MFKSNNTQTNYEGWRVSYLPNQQSSINTVLDLEDAGQDETALIIDGVGDYYILNGDWQEAYAGCATVKEALELFLDNYDAYRSSYSNSKKDASGALVST
tara:strand:+ start:2558 stop:2857 length:300 start_codon:yes stop_codon:yes gene_type:complete